jgi:DNA recombination protein RmuC
MVIAALLIGIAVGAGAVYLVVRSALGQPVRSALGERSRQRDEIAGLQRELVAAEARLEAGDATFGNRLEEAVRSASTRAFRESSGQFLEVAQARIATTVAPLADSLQQVGQRVQELDRARAQSYGALRKEVELLSERAGSLANALRSPDVRGRWGEAQLRNVVERAGMLEYCDFVTQAGTRGAEGELLRPDLVVRIPGGKSVVVDAKVPLGAYLDAFETADEVERRAALSSHARQVRDHVAKLAAKAYWRQFAPAPDVVVMFVPDETLLRIAHEHDPRLSEDAWSANVVLASPSTLMMLLRTVASIWQQETVAQSAREVHELGQELHARLGTFAGHLAKVGRALTSATGSYNDAVGSLESRVLVTARRLADHGVTGELGSPAQIEVQPRAVAAGEPDSPALEAVSGDARAA